MSLETPQKMLQKPVRILLAEDEEHIAKLIHFKLNKEGFSVGWAKDGREALNLAQTAEWDAIVLDVMMPYLDGWRVLNQLREDQNLTPVLMLTAKGTESDISKSLELGATRFLKKPFNPVELVEVLNEILAEQTSREQTSRKQTSQEQKNTSADLEMNDEMQEMKAEFVASFADRKAILEKCLDRLSDLILKSDSTVEIAQITLEIRVVAHNLAGIAKNYGFAELGTQATIIDDELAQEQQTRSTQELKSYCERLTQAML
jgi:DNA-binding response OmpR family regulator